VLLVVVVLGLPIRKAIEHDDEDEHDKERPGFFPDRPRGRRRPPSAPVRKAIEHDDEDEHDKERAEFPDRARGRRRPRSAGREEIEDD
jgi:hypothetical protein